MDVSTWLLGSDPAIRWQTMVHLGQTSKENIAAERARVATTGWGGRILDVQGADGQWAGGTYLPEHDDQPGQPWTATAFTLQLLREFGVDPANSRVRGAVARVRESSRWEYDGSRFFDGEVEPCINGLTVGLGAYFGERVDNVVERLLSEQLADGGWNCDCENGSVRSSFHTTIAVLEGLREYAEAVNSTDAVALARARGHEYLLERQLMRRLSTGTIVEHDWLQFSFPPRWHYDVLRALDYFRASGLSYDSRMDDALTLVESKRRVDGRWLLENTHLGSVHFAMDDGDGTPSRWNTLRALRVLKWFGRDSATSAS
ncbi:MAG: prenyltransferase/squalene oxidase repeat-containing protein [Rhodoglobus sp.]